MSADKYRSEQVQRVLRVLLALAGNEFRGMLLKEVAAAADCTTDNALRALENLRTAGWQIAAHMTITAGFSARVWCRWPSPSTKPCARRSTNSTSAASVTPVPRTKDIPWPAKHPL